MNQVMTSFVLRFVREVSEEQEARWRGLIQHVQSGTERNFTTFTDAVKFIQTQVLENTVDPLEKGERMTDKNPFIDLTNEMSKMWGDLGPQMVEMWSKTAEQVMGQSMALRPQIDQAVATALKAWGLPTATDQEKVLNGLAQLGQQIERLNARVEALEKELAAQQTPPKRRRSTKRATAETTE